MAFDREQYENWRRLVEQHAHGSLQGAEQYRYFLERLGEMCDTMQKFDTPNADGLYPAMSANDIAALYTQYNEVLTAEEQFRKAVPAQPEGATRACLAIAEQVADSCARDRKVLQNSTGMSGITLHEIIGQARTTKLDLGGARLGSMGGAQSSRIPLEYLDDNGNTVKGFFSAYTKNDTPTGEYNKVEKDVLSEAHRTKGINYVQVNHYEEAFDALRRTSQFSYWMGLGNGEPLFEDPKDNSVTRQEKLDEGKLRKEGVAVITRFVSSLETDYSPSYAYNFLAKTDLPDKLKTELGRDKNFPMFLSSFLTRCQGVANRRRFSEYSTHADTLVKMEDRNAAMTAVSDLLGVGHLLARSHKMTVTHFGEEIEGVFMQRASGTDLSTLAEQGADGLYHPIEVVGRVKDRSAMENPDALKSIAQLQALDYICGNVDRHMGNLFFQFDDRKPARLMGVIGIDNDSSFGTHESKAGFNRMIGPRGMAALPKSFADRVLALNQDSLNTVLQGYHLSNDEREAAWVRLTNLQEAIQRSLQREANPDDPKFALERGAPLRPRIVPDAEWHQLTAQDLACVDPTCRSENYFIRVAQELNGLKNEAAEEVQKKNEQLKQVQKLEKEYPNIRQMFFPDRQKVRGTMQDAAARNEMYRLEERAKVGTLVERMTDVDKGFFIGSKAFHTLRSSVRALNGNMLTLKPEKDVTPEQHKQQLERLLISYLEVKKSVKPYLQKKNTEEVAAKASDLAIRRRAFARDLNEFVSERIVALQGELMQPVLQELAQKLAQNLPQNDPLRSLPAEEQAHSLRSSPAFRKMVEGKSLSDLLNLKTGEPEALVGSYKQAQQQLQAKQQGGPKL